MPEKRKRRKEARPQEILEAAIQSFAQYGFAATRVEQIAEQAGIAKGTVYRYFATKEEIFEVVVKTYIQPIFNDMAKMPVSSEASATELLRLILETFYQKLINSVERRVIMKLIISEGAQFPHLVQFYHREILMRAQKLLVGVIEKGVATGEFRRSPATQEPRVIVGPAMLAAIWQMTFQTIAPLEMEKYIQAHIDLVLNGITC